MKISSILDQIDLGNYALPVFQRGYVWNRDQVRKLMTSLYKEHPIGSLLIWDTKVTDDKLIRGNNTTRGGSIRLILDGQQRVTSLYGIARGKKPPFFEGDERAFTGLYFNVETEVFEFYAPMKMENNSLWINVTDIMKNGLTNYFGVWDDKDQFNRYMPRLYSIQNILESTLPILNVTGDNMTVDIVVEIFNNVNSGGTKLSKGDLALAKLTASWPDARKELNRILDNFKRRGFIFSMDWLLRNITVYLTSQPYFSGLTEVGIHDFKNSLVIVEKNLRTILDHIGSRLGLDHNRVVKSHFSFPIIIQLIKDNGGKITNYNEWNKIMYWYIHAFLWGRYSASTESVLAQDLNILKDGKGIEGLINQLRKSRSSLEIRAEDFYAWGSGSRSYPLLYLLTRVYGSRDFLSGLELKSHLLGKHSSLELHHIFPKSLLYAKGFDRMQVNTLANYTFLTKESNLSISNKDPKVYLSAVTQNMPGVLESHWIPTESHHWEIDNYLDFVSERREKLAEAANSFLDKLYDSKLETEVDIKPNISEDVVDLQEEEQILGLTSWMEEQGLSTGEFNYEVVDEEGNNLAIFDVAWPNGIQEGLSKPVAVLIEEPDYVLEVANTKGFLYYTDIEDFKIYVKNNYL